MEKSVKIEIIKMCIPIIGIWWVIKRIIPQFPEIDWWCFGWKPIFTVLGLFFYQILCWIGWKVFYMMVFFHYSFEKVFTNW